MRIHILWQINVQNYNTRCNHLLLQPSCTALVGCINYPKAHYAYMWPCRMQLLLIKDTLHENMKLLNALIPEWFSKLSHTVTKYSTGSEP